MASTKTVVCCQEKRFNDRSKMKKTYIAPKMEVLELDIEALMISMSAPNGDGPGYGGEAGSSTGNGSMEADANGRRGEWGNLWECESRSGW